jgi:hypothetical protein
MRRLVLLIFIPCFLSAHSLGNNGQRADFPFRIGIAEESVRDSNLVAYLEKKDSLNFSLVFENKTSDTMIMRAKFEHYRFSTADASFPQGFMVDTYHDRELFAQVRDEVQLMYHMSEADSISELRWIGPISWIFPHSKAKIHFTLDQFWHIMNTPKGEYGIQFFVRYSYISRRTRQLKPVDATTNYIPLTEPKK